MIQRTHGIESMRGVPRAGMNSGTRCLKRSIGVAQAHQNFAARRRSDCLQSSSQLWSNGHHLYVAPGGLPKALEYLRRGFREIFRRMHAASLMTEKRPFQVNAQRQSLD